MAENGDFTVDEHDEPNQEEAQENEEITQEVTEETTEENAEETENKNEETGESETKEPGNEEDDRKLFVRGLNYNTKIDTLKAYCEKYGEVEKCEIKTHPNGLSRGFAFVVYKDASCVKDILAVDKHDLDSRTLEIKLANKREKITKVFVGGLSKQATDEQIRTHFEVFGKISEIDLPMDANNQRRGFCFINYETEEGLKKATEKRIHTINDQECEVKKTQPKSRGGMRGGGDGWRGGRGRGGYGRGGFGGGYGGYGGYDGGYGGYGGYDYYGGYGGGWGYDPYGGYGGYGGGQQSGFGKQRGRGRGGYRPY